MLRNVFLPTFDVFYPTFQISRKPTFDLLFPNLDFLGFRAYSGFVPSQQLRAPRTHHPLNRLLRTLSLSQKVLRRPVRRFPYTGYTETLSNLSSRQRAQEKKRKSQLKYWLLFARSSKSCFSSIELYFSIDIAFFQGRVLVEDVRASLAKLIEIEIFKRD